MGLFRPVKFIAMDFIRDLTTIYNHRLYKKSTGEIWKIQDEKKSHYWS